MHLTLKLKIQPDSIAQSKLWGVSNRCTELWNACLEQRKDPKAWGKVNVYSQKKEIPAVKAVCPEFKVPSSQVLQNVVFGLDRAYKMFFTKRKTGDINAGQPKFKSRRYFYTQEYSQPKISFAIEDQILKLSYGKRPQDWIKISIPNHAWATLGKVKTATISYDDLSKNWNLCLSHEITDTIPQTFGHVVLFDPGSKTALTGIKLMGHFGSMKYHRSVK